jgi:hypothetical protein
MFNTSCNNSKYLLQPVFTIICSVQITSSFELKRLKTLQVFNLFSSNNCKLNIILDIIFMISSHLLENDKQCY